MRSRSPSGWPLVCGVWVRRACSPQSEPWRLPGGGDGERHCSNAATLYVKQALSWVGQERASESARNLSGPPVVASYDLRGSCPHQIAAGATEFNGDDRREGMRSCSLSSVPQICW